MIAEIVKNFTCSVCFKSFETEFDRYNYCKDFHNGSGLEYIKVLEEIYQDM